MVEETRNIQSTEGKILTGMRWLSSHPFRTNMEEALRKTFLNNNQMDDYDDDNTNQHLLSFALWEMLS